jgi:hypothetical protein
MRIAGEMIDEDVALAQALCTMAQRLATVVGVIYQLDGVKGMTEWCSQTSGIWRDPDEEQWVNSI